MGVGPQSLILIILRRKKLVKQPEVRAKERPVTANPSPMAESMAVFHTAWYRLALLFYAAFLAVLGFLAGPSNPPYALMVAWGTASLEPAIPVAVMRHVPLRWLQVPQGERMLHRILGVGIFGRLLDLIGWNSLIRPMRGFTGTRAGLLGLREHARFGAIGHGICFAIHAAFAILALFTDHPWRGALWMLWPGMILHLYPTLLQRSILLRIQPLLAKADGHALAA
jgi:hypothetical protein